jgi:uncharacterized membrane protein YphA (DoxX/SURF4 family)
MFKNFKNTFFGTLIEGGSLLNFIWLIFRVHIGITIAIHAGLPKIIELSAPGWFAEQVAGLGFTYPSPMFWATVASWGEFLGGIMIAIGCCTRLAAFQLAFQFFIIAFVWYDAPLFFVGMYYQQLLFWCFVLISILGSGAYSFDKYIQQRPLKKILNTSAVAVILLLTFATNINAQSKPLNGSGLVKSITLDYENFDKLNFVGMNGKIKITVGKKYAVTISADENLLPLFNSRVEDGKLYIEIGGNKRNRRYIENNNITVTIEMPEISVFEYEGNGNITINDVIGRYLRVNKSGNANMTVSGKILDKLDLISEGNGDFDSTDLTCKEADIEMDGNGDVTINCIGNYNLDAQGNGNFINKTKK